MGLVIAVLVVGILVAVLVVFHILKEAEDGAGAGCPQPVLSCHKWLSKALPVSAIKIVVVVLQIIMQVGSALLTSDKRVPLKRMNDILIVPKYMW